MPWIAIGLTVLLGAVFAQQPVINSAVNKALGSPISATVFSVSITLLCAVLLLPVTGANFRPQLLSSLPWWSVLGGIIGVGIVAGGAYLAPIMGAALFFVCLVGGQLLGAAIADHIGAFGIPVRSLTFTRGLGLVLVVVGALLVSRG